VSVIDQGGKMSVHTIMSLWIQHDKKKNLKVRFEDWGHQIKYFTILAESDCGRRLVGKLDTGEPMSFSKISRGWALYGEGSESIARAV
jgi:hypothetical protein